MNNEGHSKGCDGNSLDQREFVLAKLYNKIFKLRVFEAFSNRGFWYWAECGEHDISADRNKQGEMDDYELGIDVGKTAAFGHS